MNDKITSINDFNSISSKGENILTTQEAEIEKRLRRECWTMHERLLKASGRGVVNQSTVQGSELDRWRRQVAPEYSKNFDKRLRWDELDEKDATWVLDPPTSDTPLTADWWPVLESIRKAAREAKRYTNHQELLKRGSNQPFVHVWRPASEWALNCLRQCCGDLEPRLHLNENSWLDLGEALLERLCTTADQALWELFNQRRTPGQILLAHLGKNGDGKGEPMHESYDAFVAELLESGYGLLLSEFPVLGRLIAVITSLWLESSEEMLRRLAESLPELQEQFEIEPSAQLEEIQLGLSDPHRGGRVVAILKFGHGINSTRVVYKPKNMMIDATYQRYLQILNKTSKLPALRCLKVLPREDHGFMEWVEHHPCVSEEELANFYTNAGRTVALLHLLGCTDCHYENLIAAGDQLLLIDTETLLEADMRDMISDDGDDFEAISELQTSIQGSVLRSGLLPQWLMAGVGRKIAFDISALGIQPPPTEIEIPGWLGLNSDGMMHGRTSQPCSLPTSLPVALGSPERLTDFVEELCNGFKTQLQDVLCYRPVLLDALEAFSGHPRRLVARATRLYFMIQRQMLEPGSLRNSIGHGLNLELLSRSFVLANKKPLNWLMFRAEVLQMEQLDIPFFEHLIDSEEMPLQSDLESIQGFMKNSGLQAARRRLETLDEHEINFQEQLIRGAIAARHLSSRSIEEDYGSTNILASYSSAFGTSSDLELASDLYRKEAFRLGEELWASAIRDKKGQPEWLGIDIGANGEAFGFGLIGNSLYSGASGIALLFMGLAVASKGNDANTWRERAWSCLKGLAELAECNKNNQLYRLVRDQPLGLSGTGGILLSLGILHREGITEAGSLAAMIIDEIRPEQLLKDESLDVLGGVAGLIGPLLASKHPKAQNLAAVCGERLHNLQKENGGWPSDNLGKKKPSLTGFSHGAAGMGAALALLAHRSGDAEYAMGAKLAMAYESSVFNDERGNWPDFRSSSEAKDFMLSWCHGAPGILLSRQVFKQTYQADNKIEDEIRISRSSTLKMILQTANYKTQQPAHLCCGILGLTSLLRIDAQVSGCILPTEVIKAEISLILKAKADGHYNFFSIDKGSINLPGFFTGTSGVALALLEAANGQRWIPEILSAGLLTTPRIESK